MTTKTVLQTVQENGLFADFTFSYTPMEGNKDIAILHGTKRITGAPGFGTRAGWRRDMHLQSEGFYGAICTVNASNVAEIKTLENRQYKRVYTFDGSYVEESVHLYAKNL